MTGLATFSFLKNMRAGGKLVFARPVARSHFRIGLNQLVALIAALITMVIVADYFKTGEPRLFSAYGVMAMTFHLAVLFAGIYLVTTIQRAPEMFSGFAVILLSSWLVLGVVMIVYIFAMNFIGELTTTGSEWPDKIIAMAATGVILGWAFLITFRAIRTLYVSSIVRSLCLAIGFTVLWFSPICWAGLPDFWYTEASPNKNNVASRPRPNVEQTYYAQPRLMRSRLTSLAENRPNVTDLYFLGFAGAGYQDVFMREVKSVTRLFDDRFDTEDRSLGLINNMATLKTHPLANSHNLNWALQGMAAKMDLEQDVLFLFLTSHGSKNATLETRFWPLRHNILSANRLSDALDRSGIKWRVIVVSACYSGSFIEALEDDHTLVITASRPDRNSFGCSNEADYTYFGRAYFDEALRAKTSFIEAFEFARKTVDKRERKEGFKPSEPQMVVGRHIAAKLRELEQRLENSEVSAVK